MAVKKREIRLHQNSQQPSIKRRKVTLQPNSTLQKSDGNQQQTNKKSVRFTEVNDVRMFRQLEHDDPLMLSQDGGLDELLDLDSRGCGAGEDGFDLGFDCLSGFDFDGDKELFPDQGESEVFEGKLIFGMIFIKG